MAEEVAIDMSDADRAAAWVELSTESPAGASAPHSSEPGSGVEVVQGATTDQAPEATAEAALPLALANDASTVNQADHNDQFAYPTLSRLYPTTIGLFATTTPPLPTLLVPAPGGKTDQVVEAPWIDYEGDSDAAAIGAVLVQRLHCTPDHRVLPTAVVRAQIVDMFSQICDMRWHDRVISHLWPRGETEADVGAAAKHLKKAIVLASGPTGPILPFAPPHSPDPATACWQYIAPVWVLPVTGATVEMPAAELNSHLDTLYATNGNDEALQKMVDTAAEIKALEEKRVTLEQQINLAQTPKTEYDQIVQNLEREVQMAKKRLSDTFDSKMSMKQKLDALSHEQSDMNGIAKQVKVAMERLHHTQSHLTRTQQRRADANVASSINRAEHEARIADFACTELNYRGKIGAAKERIAELRTKELQLKLEFENREAIAAPLRAQRSRLRKLDSETEASRAQIEADKTVIAAAEEALKITEAQRAELAARTGGADLAGSLAAVEAEIIRLRADAIGLSRTLARKNSKCRALSRDAEELQEALAKTARQMQNATILTPGSDRTSPRVVLPALGKRTW